MRAAYVIEPGPADAISVRGLGQSVPDSIAA